MKYAVYVTQLSNFKGANTLNDAGLNYDVVAYRVDRVLRCKDALSLLLIDTGGYAQVQPIDASAIGLSAFKTYRKSVTSLTFGLILLLYIYLQLRTA